MTGYFYRYIRLRHVSLVLATPFNVNNIPKIKKNGYTIIERSIVLTFLFILIILIVNESFNINFLIFTLNKVKKHFIIVIDPVTKENGVQQIKSCHTKIRNRLTVRGKTVT